MNFHPDPSKQAQEVSFRKLQKKSSYLLQQQPSRAISSQKHLEMILDTKLNFQEHIKNMLKSIKLLDYYESCKTSCLVKK